MFEFDSGIVCCELPVHPFLHSIPIRVPFLEFRVQVFQIIPNFAQICTIIALMFWNSVKYHHFVYSTKTLHFYLFADIKNKSLFLYHYLIN